MSGREHLSSPGQSRRVRRHAMGASNANSFDDGASSSARSSVTLIHAGRLVRVAPQDRPYEPVARETRTEDRPIVNKVHDKLFKTHREPFVHKVLRSYTQDDSGLLTPDQLRSALDRLHLGLDSSEKDRIVARVAPAQHGKVHYLDFIRSLEIPQPLGGEAEAVVRGSSLPGPPMVRPGGGGRGAGDGSDGTYWNWQRHKKQYVPGLLEEVREGTFEQAQSDALLTSLLSTKLNQYRDKLRIIFRQMDANRNSTIDRDEFIRGIAKLRINVSKAQVERLFTLCDTDSSGELDYEEFVNRFEERGLSSTTQQTRANLAANLGGAPAVPLAQTLGLTSDEVEGALRHPMVHELARSLYGKATGAHTVFVRHDLTRCGQLAVRDMTKCCQALVPGIGERQVAAVMAMVDPSSPGHVDYRAFVSKLMDSGVANPRVLHSAPARGEAGALTRFGEGGSLTAPEALPSPGSRSLSAMGMSRTGGVTGSAACGPGQGLILPPTGTVPLGTSATRPAADRSSLDDLHDVCIAPFLDSMSRTGNDISGIEPGTYSSESLPSVTRSIDMGTLGRSGAQHQAWQTPRGGGGVGDGGRTGVSTSTSKAPTYATGRFSRFYDKRYADTSYITSVDPSCASYAPTEGSYVRKGWGAADASTDFLTYQGADRENRGRRREQHKERHTARSEVDSKYSAVDDASGLDDGRLQVARATKQRYEERSEMYDRTRQMEDKGGSCIFGRLPPFHEHQLESANSPARLYW